MKNNNVLKYDVTATYFERDDTTIQLLSFYCGDADVIDITTDYYKQFKNIFPKLYLPDVIEILTIQKGTLQVGLISQGNPYKIQKEDWGKVVLLRLDNVKPAHTIIDKEYCDTTYYQYPHFYTSDKTF